MASRTTSDNGMPCARNARALRTRSGSSRTLISFDRDYLDDRKFPPAESGGVIILSAREERGCLALLKRLDAELFQPSLNASMLPLEGRKVHAHVDWTGETVPPAAP